MDLSAYVGTYPVSISSAVELADGKVRRAGRRTLVLTPQTLEARIETLASEVHRCFGAPTCLLSLAPTDGDTNVEHVLLQGLGVRWVELPKGFVRASNNNLVSAAEQQFLRCGLMGMLRPFYVGSKKEVGFDFPDGTTVKFVNDPSRGFEIHVVEPDGAPLRDLGLPDSSREAVLRLEVPVTMPDPRAASAALHKLTYLTLCLADPAVALDAALQPTRDCILGHGDYRPFAETFLPGAPPGFEAHFGVSRRTDGGVGQVQAVVRLHHVRYTLGLAGTDFVSRLDDVVPEHLPGSSRRVTVEFGIGSMQRRTAKEEEDDAHS